MEKRDDVAAAFVGKSITLFPAAGKELNQKDITETLAALKVKVTEFKKSKELPL